MRAPSVATRRQLSKAILPVGVLLSALLVYQSSHAAFTATTTNPGNAWSTGSVVLTDSRGGDSTTGAAGSVMFNLSGLKPGDTATQCIVVTYSGSLAGNVELYVSASAGTLRTYLDFDVTERQGDCTTPGAATGQADFSGTLSGFATTHGSYAAGFGDFAPPSGSNSNPVTRAYRFTYTVQDDNQAQNTSASATLTWRADNS